jgi:hypothetical protein
MRTVVFVKAMMLFIFQMILLGACLVYFVRNIKSYGLIWCNRQWVFLGVFITVYLIHVQICPSVFTTFKNIGYLYTHSDRFDTTFLPMLLCLMRMISNLFLEYVAMFALYIQNDEFVLITGFTAISAVVKTIDAMYYQVT